MAKIRAVPPSNLYQSFRKQRQFYFILIPYRLWNLRFATLHYGIIGLTRPVPPVAKAKREPAVITFRHFKNTDPPALADVWNESHPARSAYPLRTPGLLERWIFSKPYFDPDGLIVATDDESNKVVGYVLAGFGPNALELSGAGLFPGSDLLPGSASGQSKAGDRAGLGPPNRGLSQISRSDDSPRGHGAGHTAHLGSGYMAVRTAPVFWHPIQALSRSSSLSAMLPTERRWSFTRGWIRR